MKFADQRATFNRRVVNRAVRPLSGRFAMWSLIEHRGRRSGKQYRTPVTMFRTTDGVAIMLAYGEDRDWVRNVMDAGGGRVINTGLIDQKEGFGARSVAHDHYRIDLTAVRPGILTGALK